MHAFPHHGQSWSPLFSHLQNSWNIKRNIFSSMWCLGKVEGRSGGVSGFAPLTHVHCDWAKTGDSCWTENIRKPTGTSLSLPVISFLPKPHPHSPSPVFGLTNLFIMDTVFFLYQEVYQSQRMSHIHCVLSLLWAGVGVTVPIPVWTELFM